MSTTLIVLPEPAHTALPDLLDACRLVYRDRHEFLGSDDLEVLKSQRRVTNAIERMVKDKQTRVPVTHANRILEAAVGRALPPAKETQGKRTDLSVATDKSDGLTADECYDFRLMASYLDIWMPELDLRVAERKPLSRADVLRIIEHERRGPIEPPTGKHRIIYADPPWEYADSGLQEYGHASFHYPTMSIAELCDLPIRDNAGDDAVLFLWVTSPLLERCFEVVRSWGFEYKTSFVWDKVRHNFGHYNSVRHEFLLVCTRGSCTPDVPKLYDSVQQIERTSEHSEKPQEFREIIDTLYPPRKTKEDEWIKDRLELFGREEVPEWWKVWGNEPVNALGAE